MALQGSKLFFPQLCEGSVKGKTPEPSTSRCCLPRLLSWLASRACLEWKEEGLHCTGPSYASSCAKEYSTLFHVW